MITVREILSTDRLWLLDLTVLLVYGGVLGFQSQRAADSGQLHPEMLIRAVVTGFISYFIGFISAILLKKWRKDHVYWASAAIIGSIIFSSAWGIVFFIFDAQSPILQLLKEYYSFFIGRLVFQTLLFAVPILFLLAFLRFSYFLFKNRHVR